MKTAPFVSMKDDLSYTSSILLCVLDGLSLAVHYGV